MSLSIAQIKVVPEKGNLDANHDALMSILHAMAPGNVDVLITPECFLDGYVCTEPYVTSENIADYAIDPEHSDYITDVSRWAESSETWVILGCMRRDGSDSFNTSLAINPRGEVVCMYDKVHCQTHDQKYAAGQSLPVVEAEFGTFGMMICADRRWPETVRTLALRGADIIFNPTYGMHNDVNLRMMQTRSYESEVFIAFTHPRQSLVTDPRGEIVTNETDDSRPFVISEIDLSVVADVRSTASAHLRDRRPEVYD